MELIPIPLVVGLFLWVKLEVAVRLGCLLAAYLLMGVAVIPPGLLFGLDLLSADDWGQIFLKCPPLEEHRLMNIPKIFASNGPSPTTSHSHPLFTQEILQELQAVLAQIPMESLLCPGTQST